MTKPFLRFCGILMTLALAACNQGDSARRPGSGGTAADDIGVTTESAAIAGATAPRSSGKTVGVSSIGVGGAQSVAQLDTTTGAEQARAAAPASAGRKLGVTIASLGDPSESGFWIKTPLVKTETGGRIVNPANGKSANVRLIPLGGPASGGSQVSLPALQMLGVSLTDLPEIEVYEG
ncbi:hypothetical protein RM190_14060 [Paracoccus sp. CPCC 101403]|uniref:D-galactarate dehydratase n=1 Tax=Paracoccus broussonetiae TaxID=3075834 RepID=A0ABU3EFK3_9RHOB|nr:hypothetical protein [Paracoccus sp. CPCC 101403]MDT1063000.1 hypothetical protein [Paracoccus sp. CPCC 101403]